MVNDQLYTIGGSVQASGGHYIVRQADAELLALCRAGHFAYILTARQMGKSSLMLRTAEELAQEGIRSVQIDLTLIGTQVDAEGWYFGLLFEMRKQLRLTINLVAWWREHAGLGPTQRFSLFCEEVLLLAIATPLVIFIDEIDTTLSLDFTDDFYAAIRALYLGRAQRPELARLSFVLIGVATPGDLVRNPQRTPFNIGQRIEMTDFTLAEALPLADGFALPPTEAQQLLQWILEWTGGHPYLTQRLCQAVQEASPNHPVTLTSTSSVASSPRSAEFTSPPHPVIWTPATVADLVRTTFLNGGRDQDNNLQFVRDMLTKRAPDRIAVLTTYRAVLRQRPPVPDEEQSVTKSHLKLSGIAHRQQGNLLLRNRVYRTVFNERWVREHLPINWARRLQRAWRLVVGLTALSLILIFLTIFAFTQQQEARRQEQMALAQAATAVAAQSTAVAAQATSEANRQQAEQQRALAQEQGMLAGSRELAATAINQLSSDPELALLLALAAHDVGQTAQAERALRQILLATPLRALLHSHTAAILDADFSPDGHYYLTASADQTAMLWAVNNETALPKPLATLRGHRGSVVRARFSPDQEWVATASVDGAVRLWRLAALLQTTSATLAISPTVTFQAHPDGVTDLVFSPDGKRFVTTGGDATARLWDLATISATISAIALVDRPLAPFLTMTGHTGAIVNASFSPDGRHLVTASADTTARVWAIPAAPAPLRSDAVITATLLLTAHTDAVQSARFSPDGSLILTASQDGTARLWQVATGQPLLTFVHNQRVTSASFTQQGDKVLTTSADSTARLWDITQVRQSTASAAQPTPLVTLQSPTNGIRSASFSPDGNWVVTIGADGSIRQWASNGQANAILHKDPCDATNVVFHPDGSRFLTIDSDGTARLWQTVARQEAIVLQGHQDVINSARFSPDGKRVATTSADQLVGLWDVATGKPITFQDDECHCMVRAAVFDAAGKHLLVGNENNQAAVWDVETHQKVLSLTGHRGPVNSVNFSPDQQWIVTGSSDQTARLWNAESGEEVALLQGHQAAVTMVSFRPDGKLILSASADQTAMLWAWSPSPGALTATRTITPLRTLSGATERLSRARFSPDGQRIVTGGLHEPARLWRVERGQLLLTIADSQEQADQVLFSPDGNYLLTAGADGNVRVWNATTGALEVTFAAHSQRITAFNLSQDGRQFVTASVDQTVHLYPWETIAPLPELLRRANAQRTRILTCPEQQQYLHLTECANS